MEMASSQFNTNVLVGHNKLGKLTDYKFNKKL